MKFINRLFLGFSFVLFLVTACPGRAQSTQSEGKADAENQQKNTDAYIALLRRNVKQEKAEIMGSMMALSAQDAAKFWPIYSDYEAALTELNNQRVANIKEYADSYNDMTDAKADDLVQKSLAFQKQRSELFAKTYDLVKQALGGVTAARFAPVEHQLLLLVDLQISASLPIVGSGS